jgi:hypothetical protein
MCHAKYYALLEKKRFLSPIGDNPQKILDLGCGTGNFLALGLHGQTGHHGTILTHVSGIWTIDVADMFPSADVRQLKSRSVKSAV